MGSYTHFFRVIETPGAREPLFVSRPGRNGFHWVAGLQLKAEHITLSQHSCDAERGPGGLGVPSVRGPQNGGCPVRFPFFPPPKKKPGKITKKHRHFSYSEHDPSVSTCFSQGFPPRKSFAEPLKLVLDPAQSEVSGSGVPGKIHIFQLRKAVVCFVACESLTFRT